MLGFIHPNPRMHAPQIITMYSGSALILFSTLAGSSNGGYRANPHKRR